MYVCVRPYVDNTTYILLEFSWEIIYRSFERIFVYVHL